jgi:hypothetical protein
MKPDRIVRDLRELEVLRAALTRVPDYKPGNVTVRMEFAQEHIKNTAVRDLMNETLVLCIKSLATTNEMRDLIAARIQARITTLETKYADILAAGGGEG